MATNPHDQILPHLVDEQEDGSRVRIYRVPIYMKERSPDDFVALELFVGFYTHPALVTDKDPMHLDFSKLAIAREFCRGPEPQAPPVSPASLARRPIQPHLWAEFISGLQTELKLARGKYDRLTSDESHVDTENAVVALDALFIVAYLRFNYMFDDVWGYDFAAVFETCRFSAQRFPLLHDLLMLENQVPMSLLRAVMDHFCKSANQSENELYDMLEWFVCAVYPFNHAAKLDVCPDDLQRHLEKSHKYGCDSFVNCHHLLDCAYLAICGPHNPAAFTTSEFCGLSLPCFKPGNIGPSDLPAARNRCRIPSATSLRRVGISVKVKDTSRTMNSIKFERVRHKYVLLVPKLIMNDNTASVFRNLALYEQIRDNGYFPRGDMRTYLYLMSSLIDSVHDVRLLMNRGVIVNQLGSAETVCKQWNSMCDGLYIPPTPPAYWSLIQYRISDLEKSKSNRWFAEIEERNFSSFVLFGSFVAFTIIFISTLVQAIFSVLAYTTT